MDLVADLRRMNLQAIRNMIEFGEMRREQMKKDKAMFINVAMILLIISLVCIGALYFNNPEKIAARNYWDEIILVGVMVVFIRAIEWASDFFIKKNDELLNRFCDLLDKEESRHVQNLQEIGHYGESKVPPMQARKGSSW